MAGCSLLMERLPPRTESVLHDIINLEFLSPHIVSHAAALCSLLGVYGVQLPAVIGAPGPQHREFSPRPPVNAVYIQPMEGLQGHLIEGSSPPFLVDKFRRVPSLKALRDNGITSDFAFFLSHFHSDHYGGLSRHWSRGSIWCSPETGNLIERILGVRPHLVQRLPVGPPVKIHGVQVTLIDANHCPGSVMFLFEGPGVGRCLHCGDFRYTPRMLQQINPRPPAALDRIYLDTTYADKKMSFPPQQEVLDKALQIACEAMEEAKKGGGPVRLLVGTYTIGKERIALHLARSCGLRIFVAKEKRRVLGCLEFSPEVQAGVGAAGASQEICDNFAGPQEKNLFTENPQDAQIDLVPLNVCGRASPPSGNFVSIRSHLCALGLPTNTRAVAFVATGWALGAKKTTLKQGNCSVHLLPYSEHSSLAELQEFVSALNPREVIPTVTGHDSNGFSRLYRLFNPQAGVVDSKEPPQQAARTAKQQQQQKMLHQQRQQQQGQQQQRHKKEPDNRGDPRQSRKRQLPITTFFRRSKAKKESREITEVISLSD